jgi:deoxyribose-phosphate aldolase
MEARRALEDGAGELDMVVNIGKVKGHDWGYLERELAAVLDTTHEASAKLKVIFENCYLTDVEKIRLCEICSELRVDWVKTSTGYATGGATWDDLALMRRHCPAFVQVKAAGGLRDLDAVLQARQLGATRVGASATREGDR